MFQKLKYFLNSFSNQSKLSIPGRIFSQKNLTPLQNFTYKFDVSGDLALRGLIIESSVKPLLGLSYLCVQDRVHVGTVVRFIFISVPQSQRTGGEKVTFSEWNKGGECRLLMVA